MSNSLLPGHKRQSNARGLSGGGRFWRLELIGALPAVASERPLENSYCTIRGIFFFQFVQALELHNCIVITFHFNSKTLWRWVFLSCDCFCYFTAAMMVPLMEAPTLRLHKFGWNTHEMHELKTTNLGDVVYVSIICIIPDFSLYLMNGQDFFFNENQ